MIESALTLGAATLVGWFVPTDDRMQSLFTLAKSDSIWMTATILLSFAAAVLVLEPFFVGAGFAMYLNRRVELEAWDIEQEFRLAFAH